MIWDVRKRVMVGGGVKTGFFFGLRVFIHDSDMVDWDFPLRGRRLEYFIPTHQRLSGF